MNQNPLSLTRLVKMPPQKAAEKFVALRCEDSPIGAVPVRRAARADDWLDEFSARLDALRAGHSLRRTLAVWGLSQSEAARLFGVSRQALHKWLENGPPAEQFARVADLAAATDLLVRHLKRERVPAVVRRPIPALRGKSLLDLLGRGNTKAALEACRDMFDFQAAQG